MCWGYNTINMIITLDKSISEFSKCSLRVNLDSIDVEDKAFICTIQIIICKSIGSAVAQW